MPKPKSLAGRIAFITGGASGIGRATAMRLLGEGAAVVIADIDKAALDTTRGTLATTYGKDVVRGALMDVTDEDAVIRAFADTMVEFGGIDILVSNAGISSSAPIEDTSLAMWNRNMDILAKGYFLVAREAFRAMKKQKLGGAIVFVASKNGLAASPNAAAYSTAKAAEIHLARGLALEGAPDGIRVNVVNPVLPGVRHERKIDRQHLQRGCRQRAELHTLRRKGRGRWRRVRSTRISSRNRTGAARRR
jgi:NAD(P)-dependent dehydrogenase (short-subunit alcohol dehydrogenase family)